MQLAHINAPIPNHVRRKPISFVTTVLSLPPSSEPGEFLNQLMRRCLLTVRDVVRCPPPRSCPPPCFCGLVAVFHGLCDSLKTNTRELVLLVLWDRRSFPLSVCNVGLTMPVGPRSLSSIVPLCSETACRTERRAGLGLGLKLTSHLVRQTLCNNHQKSNAFEYYYFNSGAIGIGNRKQNHTRDMGDSKLLWNCQQN